MGKKPEELPRKVREEQDKILECNRLQTLLNTDFELVKWETVYKNHIPEKVKKMWRAVIKKKKKEKNQMEKRHHTKKKMNQKKKNEEPNPL